MIMDEIKKIMTAVGFTPAAEGLIKYAVQVAQNLEAELIIVNIINSRDVAAVGTIAAMGYEVDSDHYVSGVEQERRQMLDQILQKIPYPADKIQSIFKVGNPVDELLKIAIEEDVGLIIMGIRSRSELEYAFVGSVADKIFRRSPIPVLSYRDSKSAARLKKQIQT
jgi:nucleotide-binding universal stress UspA family protein